MSQSDLDTAREEVIEAIARSLSVYGVNQSYGRLYGILYFAEEPISLDGLTDESSYSKSTVSAVMRTLERMHVVHRRSIPGEGKKAFFEAETDFWHIAQELMDREVTHEVEIMNRALDSAAETFETIDSAQAQRDLEKVRQYQQLFNHIELLVELFTNQSEDQLMAQLEGMRDGNAD